MTAQVMDQRAAADRRIGSPILWDIIKMPARILTSWLFDLKVYGAEHLPPSGGVLLISNHESNLDPVLLGVQVRRRISFIAKTELFRNPLFSWLITSLNAFPVRRGERDVGAIREALRRLHAGHVLTMFPEGTRTRNGEIGRIQPGIAMLIKRADVPIIPAVIDGAWKAWPRGKKLPRRYPIRVMYGPPLPIGKLDSHEIVTLVEDTLRSMLAELRAKHDQ